MSDPEPGSEPGGAPGRKAWEGPRKEREPAGALGREQGHAPDEKGWLTLTIPFEDEDQAAFVALGLGSRVVVVEPASLRTRVTADHAAALAHTDRRLPPS